jgi:hypothetical protein
MVTGNIYVHLLKKTVRKKDVLIEKNTGQYR